MRKPARPAGAREMIHYREVIRQELRFREAVAGDPGQVVGMAMLVAPQLLVRVGVVWNIGSCQSHALLANVVGYFVGDETKWMHGARGAEADVDNVTLVHDGDDVDHVVPALADRASSAPGLRTSAKIRHCARRSLEYCGK